NGSAGWNDDADSNRGRGEASRDFAKLYELDPDPKRKEFWTTSSPSCRKETLGEVLLTPNSRRQTEVSIKITEIPPKPPDSR
ncbi:hypothetical protein KUCAC02_006207, partial [Chaenocephalus aceratus]